MGWLARCLGRKLGWYTVKTKIIGHSARISRISPDGLGSKHHQKTLFQPSLETHTLLGEETPRSCVMTNYFGYYGSLVLEDEHKQGEPERY